MNNIVSDLVANRTIEYRLVDDEDLPPIVITMDENDEVKLIINTYYKIWMAANRKVIGGVAEGLFAKPVVNYADIDYKIQRKERKPITDRPKKLGKYKKKIFSASKTPYSQKTPNFRKNILKAVGKGVVAIATKNKIRLK